MAVSLPINQIKPYDKLEEPVYQNHTLVLPKGTILTSHHIEKLRNWNIREVVIEEDEESRSLSSEGEHLSRERVHNEQVHTEEVSFLQHIFHQELNKIVNERRYGELLKSDYTLKEVRDLFIQLLQEPTTKQLLMKLYCYDEYSFTHSVDVFILGYVLGKKVQITELKRFTKACILHDIGKVKISLHILQKSTKLTHHEYEIIQNHTIKGEQLMKDYEYNQLIVDLARFHHERVNGTGYPDQLSREKTPMSKELQMLMIIDVYSALTLDRSYRNAFSASKALAIMLNERQNYDEVMLYHFINTLKVYPKKSLVRLNTGELAHVMDVPKELPTLCIIKKTKDETEFMLPVDKSIYISHLVAWKDDDRSQKKIEWEYFLNSILYEDESQALYHFNLLEDGYRIEKIYTNIFEPALHEIHRLKDEKQINKAELHIGMSTLLKVMNYKRYEYSKDQLNFKGTVLVIGVGNNEVMMKIHILTDLLSSTGFRVFNMETQDLQSSLPKEELIQYIKEQEISHVALTATRQTCHATLKTVKRLKEKIPNTTVAFIEHTSHERDENHLPHFDFHTTDLQTYIHFILSYKQNSGKEK
ncbi:HD domain-containing protein [Pontibacillus yanchengensis]|uniref:HD domain-containing protein n=1 Tax=Pontibacillus yanchengensis TaxID=462910 RepID=A0ACC7VE37_9BACI|nr:HD domain-containing phosphohydrolase [Pontibacillus yanchengensis]MYL52471.1 HD domain-containing protein [Pontibacillus yanchengensis]